MGYKSNTVDIVRISAESEFYEIFANTDIISKYMTVSSDEYGINFSPLEININFYDRKAQQLIENIDYKFNIYVENNWILFSTQDLKSDYDLLNLTVPFETFFTTTGLNLVFKIQEFYGYIKEQTIINENNKVFLLYKTLNNDNGIIKIQWFIDSALVTEGLLMINYGLSQDAAKFNINASSINASIEDGFIEYTIEGLELHNGGLKITSDDENGNSFNIFTIEENPIGRYTKYIFNEGETNPKELGLYEKINENQYVLTEDTTISLNKDYYFHSTKDYKLVLDGTGTFTGDIYADNGYFGGELRAASGSFRGQLDAASGSFSGEIQASSGQIGGFLIEENQLSSDAGKYIEYIFKEEEINPKELGLYEKNNEEQYILTEDETIVVDKTYYIKEPNIVLGGTRGEIIANNISLGDGARIKNYLSLGDAFLYNPDSNNGKILEAGNIKLYENGDLFLGDLNYNSKDNIFRGSNWSISNDKAIFNNIDVSGTIHSSVFEYGKIQSVGGQMIFSPASKYEVLDTGFISLETNFPLENNSLVLLSNSLGQEVLATVSINLNKDIAFLIIDNSNNFQLNNFDTVTFLNNEGKEILMGVNSTSNRKGFLYPQGISFIQPKQKNGTGQYTEYNEPTLFLGNLTYLNKPGMSGFGLYGENVFLKGSLTTISNTGKSAGINTLSSVLFNVEELGINLPFIDNSPIMFWAGANLEGQSEEKAIQKANFQVTEDGTIYAKNGYFADTVIIGSTIGGNTTISVPSIIGSGPNDKTNTNLTLTDVSTSKKGISFAKEVDGNFIDVFLFKENFFKYYDKEYMRFSDGDNLTRSNLGKIDFIGDSIFLDSLVQIDDFQITKENNEYFINHFVEKTEKELINSISFEDDGLKFKYNGITGENATMISIEKQLITLSSSDVLIPTMLSLGDKVDIVKVQGGFNINIQE